MGEKPNTKFKYVGSKMSNDIECSDSDEDCENAWSDVQQLKKLDLKDLLIDKIRKGENPDVHVKIGNAIFHCHMLLLRFHSQAITSMRICPAIILDEDKVNAQCFKIIYEWMKWPSELLDLTKKNIINILKTANYLKIMAVCDQCWTYVDSHGNYAEDTAFQLFLEAKYHKLRLIQNLMLTRIFKYFLTLVATDEFLLFSLEDIKSLMQLSKIGINNESEVFLACVRWLNHDWENRKDNVLELMECVRFGNIQSCFLIAVQNEVIADNDVLRISRYPGVLKMIKSGILYVSLKSVFNESDQYKNLIKEKGLYEPAPRSWVYDPNCEYHHRHSCPNKYITYRAFKKHLKEIQKLNPDHWQNYKIIDDDDYLPICCNIGRREGEEGIPRVTIDDMYGTRFNSSVSSTEDETDEYEIVDE